MNFNATLVGQVLIVFALVVGVLCYYFARGKTKNPTASALLGIFLSIIPPIGLIYLALLALKKDANINSQTANGL